MRPETRFQAGPDWVSPFPAMGHIAKEIRDCKSPVDHPASLGQTDHSDYIRARNFGAGTTAAGEQPRVRYTRSWFHGCGAQPHPPIVNNHESRG